MTVIRKHPFLYGCLLLCILAPSACSAFLLKNFIVGGAVWLSRGYLSRSLTLNAMLADMARRKSLADSRRDILWYLGTKNGQHFFKHIRGAFLDEAYYRVDTVNMRLSASWAYSDDSDAWGIVVHIDSRWRPEYQEDGRWLPDETNTGKEGCRPWRCIAIEATP